MSFDDLTGGGEGNAMSQSENRSSTARHEMSITVVMPAYNAAHLLPKVLSPLIELHASGELDAVIVIDDQSTDDTVDVARSLGATVIRTPQNGGPGAARNLAAEKAKSDILWFVDSDVIAWSDGPEHIREVMSDKGVGAMFGSYDDAPEAPGWFSQYKNLLHRYHHQRARRDAKTFWAGCGAIRRDVFLEVGGFDVTTYQVPSIEDIEIGYRIARAGYGIVVEPAFQGKHLKNWTIGNGIHTDIFRRALPWSRLMIAREGLGNDLNTGLRERTKALVAGFLLLSVLALPFAPALWPATLVLLAAAFALNIRFARMIAGKRGIGVAIAAVLFHQIYFVYSAAAYVWCLFEYHVLGKKQNLSVKK